VCSHAPAAADAGGHHTTHSSDALGATAVKNARESTAARTTTTPAATSARTTPGTVRLNPRRFR
jgi:hypothetical protein